MYSERRAATTHKTCAKATSASNKWRLHNYASRGSFAQKKKLGRGIPRSQLGREFSSHSTAARRCLKVELAAFHLLVPATCLHLLTPKVPEIIQRGNGISQLLAVRWLAERALPQPSERPRAVGFLFWFVEDRWPGVCHRGITI